jgi:hypothetical protein
MMRLVMEASGLALWPSISLIVFFGACLVMLAWIYRPGSRVLYRKMSGMALDQAPDSDAPSRPRAPTSSPEN